MPSIRERLAALGLALPQVPSPAGSYRPAVICGDLIFVSGQLPKTEEGLITGRVGRDISIDAACKAAGACALNALAVLADEAGEDRIARIIRLTGYVQAAEDFHEHPRVINGASDLFRAVFGDEGVHARSAVGAASLPMNAAVELEVIAQLKG